MQSIGFLSAWFPDSISANFQSTVFKKISSIERDDVASSGGSTMLKQGGLINSLEMLLFGQLF